MARKKKVEVAEKQTANFTNGDKTVYLNDRMIRNGELVTAEEMAMLVKMGVVNE